MEEEQIIPSDWIEILPDVYFDPAKQWYEQPQELIDLAFQIEQTPPTDYEIEIGVENPTHQRLKWAVWESTTEMGLFQMRVDIIYLYSIENRAFLTKEAHNKVQITKI